MLRAPRVVLSDLRLVHNRTFTMVVEVPVGWRLDNGVSPADVLFAGEHCKCWAERDGFPTEPIKACDTCKKPPVKVLAASPNKFAPVQEPECERFVFEKCTVLCRSSKAHLKQDTLVLTVELARLQFVSPPFRIVPNRRGTFMVAALVQEGGNPASAAPAGDTTALTSSSVMGSQRFSSGPPRPLQNRSVYMVVRIWKVDEDDKLKLFQFGNDFFQRFMSKVSTFVDYRVNFLSPELLVTYSHCRDPDDSQRSSLMAYRYLRNAQGFTNVFNCDLIGLGKLTQLLVSDTM